MTYMYKKLGLFAWFYNGNPVFPNYGYPIPLSFSGIVIESSYLSEDWQVSFNYLYTQNQNILYVPITWIFVFQKKIQNAYLSRSPTNIMLHVHWYLFYILVSTWHNTVRLKAQHHKYRFNSKIWGNIYDVHLFYFV